MSRTFVVGDIHGCYDELIRLTARIGLKEDDLLISVGDIIDRGGKSKEVYHYFRNRPNSIVIAGNHERKHQYGVLSYAQEIVKLQFGEEYAAFLDWCAGLAYYHETEDAVIVHAAFEHDCALEAQREDVLSGSTAGDRYLEKKYGTSAEWVNKYQGIKPVIYGHHVAGDMPEVRNNTYGIDTGACHGGYLTAIELPGFIVHQVKAEKDHWKEEQASWQIPVLRAKDWENMSFDSIRKQLDKLAYIEVPEVKAFLADIESRASGLTALYPVIMDALAVLVAQLESAHGADFSKVATQYMFKAYLFKSKANNLKIEDMQKSLNTPGKVMELARTLGVTVVPVRND
ncbi:metallophosphoesterase [Chitinophaga filiformis]|uniref:Metallophosphoesterase n=1 Tax=Chitinophaga filiformis TaxID=104663 RepID=A0ABY4I5L8_CHIFI|nr:metallophosphoesterase [Chitinophaga filiformis]UPK71375.1 metallophosphoesterase [Chitinophaga filiformis]